MRIAIIGEGKCRGHFEGNPSFFQKGLEFEFMVKEYFNNDKRKIDTKRYKITHTRLELARELHMETDSNGEFIHLDKDDMKIQVDFYVFVEEVK